MDELEAKHGGVVSNEFGKQCGHALVRDPI